MSHHISRYSEYLLKNLVLVNNAGIAKTGPQPYSDTHDTLSGLRQHYDDVLSTNLTSVAVITTAFRPLLHVSKAPKVINITSGLSSMTRMLKMRFFRTAVYGSSKVGLNGLTVHMQIAEGDWADKEGVETIKYYTVEVSTTRLVLTSSKLLRELVLLRNTELLRINLSSLPFYQDREI